MNAMNAMVNGALCSAVLAALVWAAVALSPRKFNAATRYVVWWAALFGAILLPLCYLPLPQIALPRTASALPTSTPAVPVVQPHTAPAPGAGATARRRIVTDAAVRPPQALPVWQRRPLQPIRVPATPWPRYFFESWAVLSTLLLARVVLGWIGLQAKSATAEPAGEALCARAGSWLAAAGAQNRTRIRVGICDALRTPVAVGPIRPAILIPRHLLGSMDAAELDQIGIHEAAHFARRDDYAILLQRSVEAIFALHPVVRWLGRRIDLEREIACDDVVLAATGRARSYASCLTRVVEICGAYHPALAGAAAGSPSHLARRIDLLLDRSRNKGTRLSRSRVALVAGAAAALAVAAVRLPAPVVFARAMEAPLAHAHLHARFVPAAAVAVPAPQNPATGFEARIIEDSSGDPLPSAELRFHKAGQYELAADVETGGDGVARAASLPAGDYNLEIVKPNFVGSKLRIHAPVQGVVLRLVRFGVISGQIIDEQGKPAPARIHAAGGRTMGGTRVTILSPADAGGLKVFRESPPDETGHYRVFDLPPGQYAVAVWYDNLPNGSGMQMYPDASHPRMFAVSGGEEYTGVDFTITPQTTFSVSGKVQLPNPRDLYSLTLGLPGQPFLPVATALTQPDGAFRFERVTSGTYDLLVAGPSNGYGAYASLLGPKPNFARMRLQVAANVDSLDIAVSPARTAKVILSAQSGDKPPEGCPQSAAIDSEALDPWNILAGSRSQAVFGKETAITGLAPGKYRFTAAGLGEACYQAKEAVGDTSSDSPVAIELASAGSVEGTLAATGSAASDFVVVLIPADGQGDARVALPDGASRFSFTGLHPGDYRIAARPAGGAKARWVADLTGMQTVHVNGGAATRLQLAAKGAAQ